MDRYDGSDSHSPGRASKRGGPMSYLGKLIGGVAGFAVAGPFGAVVGAALGHAADEELMPGLGIRLQRLASPIDPGRIAALFGGPRDHVFTTSVVALSAKLAKCDGPVQRSEIDAFKRQFRIQPDAVRDIGRMFDQARDSTESFEIYAERLGRAFADNRAMLEDVLFALFQIARADGPVNRQETGFLSRVHKNMGLDRSAWDRATGATAARPASRADDAYAVLGVPASATDAEVRAAWRQTVRDNHPDLLASRGVPADFIARASEKVAAANAAWDRIKRERNL